MTKTIGIRSRIMLKRPAGYRKPVVAVEAVSKVVSEKKPKTISLTPRLET